MNTSTTSSASAAPFSIASLLAAAAGAGGGLLSFFAGEAVFTLMGMNQADGAANTDFVSLVVGSALWSAVIGLIIGTAILIYDNTSSLRGQWNRNVLLGIPLFFGLSFLGGAAGQISYSIVQNSLTRGIGWALMGASVGVGMGVVRRDMLQSARGALGGAIGGFIGGFVFDALILVSSAAGGAFSRLVGQIIMGALIGLLMKVVQDTLKNAWLLGISTGPYEGKEYPLNTAQVTVGRDDSNAIALFRERELPAKLGALVSQNGQWFWQGGHILLNGVAQSNAPLQPGDTLQIGTTRFRFQDRSVKSPHPISVPYASPDVPPAPVFSSYSNSTPTPAPSSGWGAAAPIIPDWSAPPASSSSPVAMPPSFALMAASGRLLRLPDLSSPVSVGRTAGNQVVLADAGVSSRHAQLQVSGGTLLVTDLGSTNGTFVNGVKISPQTPHTLRSGDHLRFGQLEYTLRTA